MWSRRNTALLFAGLLMVTAVSPAAGSPGSDAFAERPAFEWKVVFKLINVTAHAQNGDVGFVRKGDDTREQNEQSVRAQFLGKPAGWLSYELDYLNVKQHLDGPLPSGEPSGAALFRRWAWKRYLLRPETDAAHPVSTQTVLWYDEVDRAFARFNAGPLEAVIGRQPITWGAGRVWQPTDLFAAFSPLALDTEYKPGVDGALLSAYPGAFSSITLAYVLSPETAHHTEDSTALRYRGQLGTESEVTALAGTVREDRLAGGSLETTWLDAGWRVEALGFRPSGDDHTHIYGIAGVDYRFTDGVLVFSELYYHDLGADREADVATVAASALYRQGRQPQLTRRVLALGLQGDLSGLWQGAYTVLASALRDDEGANQVSLAQQGTLTYSISDNAEAVFSLFVANGHGLDVMGQPRSEFGHLPASLYVSLQFVL